MSAAELAGCERCRGAGRYCGMGTLSVFKAPCVHCGERTNVRSACGAARCRADHAGLPGWGPLDPPSTSKNDVQSPRCQFHDDTQICPECTAPAAATTAPETPPAEAPAEAPLRLLKLLETDHMPRRKIRGKMIEPYWRPELPGITYAAHVITGWSWHRPFEGETVTLDRNAAYLSAAASVLVGFGALEHTGPCEFDPQRAGYGLIQLHPWHEKGMPSPLGNARPNTMWVPWPTIQLLVQLSDAGRWADVTILDSYSAQGVRLQHWTDRVKEIRTDILDRYGKDSDVYARFKIAFGQVFGLLIGSEEPGKPRRWKCRAQRPDWAHTIMAQASATLWRDADKCARRLPDAGPIAIRNTDEIVLPVTALAELVQPEDGSTPTLRLDQSGRRLGTYKAK